MGKNNCSCHRLTRRAMEVTAPATNTCLNFLVKEKTVTGKNTNIENGHPRMTPITATATAIAGFSRRNKPDEREIAYIENELGRKPESRIKILNVRYFAQSKLERVSE